MATVKVHGQSDDLIEVDGAISEEFGAYMDDDDSRVLAFSDGTVLRIAYGDGGVWRITTVARGSARLTVEQAPEDDTDNYSDVATLEGDDLRWCVLGTQFVAATDRTPPRHAAGEG